VLEPMKPNNEPMKPMMKASGTLLLKLRSDEPLSNFAFNFNLCHDHEDWNAWKAANGMDPDDLTAVGTGICCLPRRRMSLDPSAWSVRSTGS
jgi:hypothetical protein